MPSEQGHRLYV
ncbi:hypothetical protein BN1723_018666, partial [Verticillium longisporum]